MSILDINWKIDKAHPNADYGYLLYTLFSKVFVPHRLLDIFNIEMLDLQFFSIRVLLFACVHH
jgi:hypothetical protein